MMRYRKLTPTGDYSFGHQQADFYQDSPEAVAQAVLTRLRLLQGEWFLDQTEGTPYSTQVLANNRVEIFCDGDFFFRIPSSSPG